MENLIINMQSINVSEKDKEALKNLLSDFIVDGEVSLSSSKSFNGFEDLIVILSIGGGVAIKQLGTIILGWINKDNKNKLTYKNIEASGYSADEVIKIIKELDRD